MTTTIDMSTLVRHPAGCVAREITRDSHGHIVRTRFVRVEVEAGK